MSPSGPTIAISLLLADLIYGLDVDTQMDTDSSVANTVATVEQR